ncbi:MAG TPA: universal stress protein [Steroidobacteraceae bacterium]|nr:universal stress protein [Steroidobacteraceae bacterium]
MKQFIHSIMAAVDRDDRSREVVAKAVALARLSGAHLELFHCDAERAYSRRHQYDSRAAARERESCLDDSRSFLDALWRSLEVSDVDASLSVACESPLYEGIVHAVQRDHPDLVVRGAGGGAAGARVAGLDANDWELVRACPSPLFLTRGKPWKSRPSIAAAIDLSAGESAELTRTILSTAAAVARSAGGDLEIIHACRLDRTQPQELESRRASLAEGAKSAGVQAVAVHVLCGEPAVVLPEHAVQRGFDLIVLGALTHRKSLTALVGTLTGRLLETLDCDFLLVKPSRAGSAAA